MADGKEYSDNEIWAFDENGDIVDGFEYLGMSKGFAIYFAPFFDASDIKNAVGDLKNAKYYVALKMNNNGDLEIYNPSMSYLEKAAVWIEEHSTEDGIIKQGAPASTFTYMRPSDIDTSKPVEYFVLRFIS